jgi:thiamine-monophosphate kinase
MKAMNETEIIRLFLKELPDKAGHDNAFFAADAEILECGAASLLFTIDSFDEEDHFRSDDPRLLGWNLAACTVSDLFACGGSLLYYGHAATVADAWDARFISQISRGIGEVIAECGGQFAGGDLGCAGRWHYTGVAIGTAARPVTRLGARPGDRLYFSGEVGAGNVEAAAALLGAGSATVSAPAAVPARFPLRHREAKLVAHHASACIDSSDGLLRSLMILSELNGTGFHCEALPYCAAGHALIEALGLPMELLMAGECGEYELLCCIPPEREAAFLRDAAAERLRFHHIGRIEESGTAILLNATRTLDLGDFAIGARQYTDHRDYLAHMTEYFQEKNRPA